MKIYYCEDSNLYLGVFTTRKQLGRLTNYTPSCVESLFKCTSATSIHPYINSDTSKPTITLTHSKFTGIYYTYKHVATAKTYSEFTSNYPELLL